MLKFKLYNFIFLIVILLIFGKTINADGNYLRYNSKSETKKFNDVNGGTTCAGCTAVISLIEQLTGVYNESVSASIARLCSYLPKGVEGACHVLAVEFGPPIIDILNKYERSDVVCNAIGFCRQDPGQPRCHLYPTGQTELNLRILKYVPLVQSYKQKGLMKFGADICQYPVVSEICKIVTRAFTVHEPMEDADGDYYSLIRTFRGSSWRGKDCHDLNKQFKPGAKAINGDLFEDSNCNGIYGRQPSSGKSYEAAWCNNTGQLGYVSLGDSVSAHFHIPPQWLTADELNEEVFQHLLFILENEFDWPSTSAGTGYMEFDWSVIEGPTDSLYKRLRERNRCNHRDFQNIAVNGADAIKMANNIIKSLARHPQTDHPLLITYALVGNDVCNGHNDTLAHMTTPEEMRTNVIKALDYLNATVPAGSHVLLMGLADGRILFDSLNGRIHPLGKTYGDITYDSFYEFLSCLQTGPCSGWMTTDAKLRNLTSERAQNLSEAIQDVVTKYETHYKNIDLAYIDCPITPIFEAWEAQGGEGWQLIEPVDGFHPNQHAQALVAEFLWKWLDENKPEWLGPENPNNDDIEKQFGEQGGYI